MNNNNTIVYIKVDGPRPANFVDPTPFDWNEEKENQLWKFISKLDSEQDHINWKQLSETFETPVYFLKNRAYKMFSMRLEQLKQKIQNKKKMLEGNHISESISLGHPIIDSPSESSFLTHRVTNRKTDHKPSSFDGREDIDNDVADELAEGLQKTKLLNYITPETNEVTDNNMRHDGDSELDSDISSNLSVSKSALEEALMARLNF
ncbi:similar to Saccharomyces cerevisiae YPL166W ATG29 Autophagy-specific protein that is required for recruitment of other ATG proteins to the pre-autophagosomal structure (PAS) [Maudiozyma saulgeensis]|uniref:Autophagy-related protein 29 n=1 Tax=Maudiozyma saulgeensis TaxID=1789683 RepID=A0A1X7RA73_9SACH|nr:similar to Saccharomyces cerevisiae YPL166W ATG29 Autophagy-specific protein that is required for recruitment of other ATG proteins to the pre-autophagosomal structure (PAS) [Kazachstania saulgeensis]